MTSRVDIRIWGGERDTFIESRAWEAVREVQFQLATDSFVHDTAILARSKL